MRRVAADAEAAWTTEGSAAGARIVMGLFEARSGGLGDVVLRDAEGVDHAASRKFDLLRRRLFQEARAALSADRAAEVDATY